MTMPCGLADDGNLTDMTTHLLATRAAPATEKIQAARRLGLPIARPDWVAASAACGTELLPLGEEHLLQPLAGVVLFAIGMAYSAVDRNAIRRAIEAAGGVFSPHLDDRVTHIVAHDEISTSERQALAGSLRGAPSASVVRSAWLKDSLRLGVAQDEAAYAAALAPPSSERRATPLSALTARTAASANMAAGLAGSDQVAPDPIKSPRTSDASSPDALIAVLRAAAEAGEVPLSGAQPYPEDQARVTLGGQSYELDAPSSLRRQQAVAAIYQSAAEESLAGPACAAAADATLGKPYTLRELLFALACSGLTHAEYFLACVTEEVDPVLLLDKKLLFGAALRGSDDTVPGKAVHAAHAAHARLSEGPLTIETIEAIGRAPFVDAALTSCSPINLVASLTLAADDPGTSGASPAAHQVGASPTDGSGSSTGSSLTTSADERSRLVAQLQAATEERERLNARVASLTHALEAGY